MKFLRSHGTENVYWLRHEPSGIAFARLHRNEPNTRKPNALLAAACDVVERAPELLAALRAIEGVSWLDADPSDSEHLAAAKQQARDVLKALEHAQ